MFLFKFGLAWTAFSLAIFFICLAGGAWEGILFIGIFIAIGFWMIANGYKQIKKDRDTDKYGKFTYGRILNISPTGSYVNNNPELKASVLFVKDGLDYVYNEIIGFDQNKYRSGQYVKIKHYNDDVNILGVVSEQSIPYDTVAQINEFYESHGGVDNTMRRNLQNMYRNQNSGMNAQPRPTSDANKKWENVDNNYDW